MLTDAGGLPDPPQSPCRRSYRAGDGGSGRTRWGRAGIGNVGVAFRSTDSGVTWAQLDFGRPISYPSESVLTPRRARPCSWRRVAGGRGGPQVSGRGSGSFAARTAGILREPAKPISAIGGVGLAIRPDDPPILMAGGIAPGTWQGMVYRSEDGGDAWQPTSLLLDWGWVSALAIDPLAPDVVYAGTDEGLFRSTTAANLEPRQPGRVSARSASGPEPRVLRRPQHPVRGDGGRLLGRRSPVVPAPSILSTRAILPGGVYQLTIDHRAPRRGELYLPLVVRKH